MNRRRFEAPIFRSNREVSIQSTLMVAPKSRVTANALGIRGRVAHKTLSDAVVRNALGPPSKYFVLGGQR